jgi:hypothetical protein
MIRPTEEAHMSDPEELKYEAMMEIAREREARELAPDRCHDHGTTVGRAIAEAIRTLEAHGVMMTDDDVEYLADGIIEACWDRLRDELDGAEIDFDMVYAGVRCASARYKQAVKQGVRS